MSAEQKKAAPNAHIIALTENHLDNPDYTPAHLLDTMLERLKLKNDAALSRAMKLPPAVISKVRSKKVSVTSAILIRFHYITGWAIADLNALMGLKAQFQPL
jgi:hypothetical protein